MSRSRPLSMLSDENSPSSNVVAGLGPINSSAPAGSLAAFSARKSNVSLGGGALALKNSNVNRNSVSAADIANGPILTSKLSTSTSAAKPTISASKPRLALQNITNSNVHPATGNATSSVKSVSAALPASLVPVVQKTNQSNAHKQLQQTTLKAKVHNSHTPSAVKANPIAKTAEKPKVTINTSSSSSIASSSSSSSSSSNVSAKSSPVAKVDEDIDSEIEWEYSHPLPQHTSMQAKDHQVLSTAIDTILSSETFHSVFSSAFHDFSVKHEPMEFEQITKEELENAAQEMNSKEAQEFWKDFDVDLDV